MITEIDLTDPSAAFARLPWHDSEFLGWNVAYDSDDEPLITFEIAFCKSDIVSGRTNVMFRNVRGFHADVDLLAKRLCGDQIASGHSEPADASQSAFIAELNRRFDLYAGESLEGLFSFVVKLIHPAGELLVVARSFSMTPMDGGGV